MPLFGECILNRRIPNGTYGGVGGWKLTVPSYLIKYKIEKSLAEEYRNSSAKNLIRRT